MNFDFFKIIPPLKNIIFSYLFETHATLFEYILKKITSETPVVICTLPFSFDALELNAKAEEVIADALCVSLRNGSPTGGRLFGPLS